MEDEKGRKKFQTGLWGKGVDDSITCSLSF